MPARDLKKEYVRAFVRKIIKNPNYFPSDKVVQKYGLTLELVNKIRQAVGYSAVSTRKRKLYDIYTNLTEYVKQHKVEEELTRAQKKVDMYKQIVENREMAQEHEQEATNLQKRARPHINKIDFERMTIDDVGNIMLELGLQKKTVDNYTKNLQILYEDSISDEEYDANYHRFMAMFKELSASDMYDMIKARVQTTTGKQNPATLNAFIKPLNWIINNLPGINDYLGDSKIKQWKSFFKNNKEDELQHTIDKMNEVIDSFATMKDKVKKKVGTDNIYYLFLLIYDIKPMRDDYKRMILKKKEENLSLEKNYLIVNGNKVKLIFNKYKDSSKKGAVTQEATSSEISKLVKKLKLEYDKPMFNSTFNEKLKKVFLDSKVKMGNNGVINYLRKSIQGGRPYADLSHSLLTKYSYTRKLK